MVKLLMEHRGGIPRWYSIVFPGMLELALAKGLPVLPDGGSMPAVNNVFNRRETILAMEKSSSNDRHPPLTSFLEALPISCRPNHEVILRLQMEDGSLFHSPSATACAFMITGDRNCLEYLQTMLKRCSNVVPSVFPVDEDLIKLCLVDHLRRLGCGEHFAEEIRGVMDHTYRYGIVWLLQLIGRAIERKFCWFMDEKDVLTHIMENYTEFLGAMVGVYRAAHFMFPEEVELHNAKVFAMKVLHKCLHLEGNNADLTGFEKEIEHEMELPWLARMDHLEHRMYIERSKGYITWIGKTNTCRLSCSSFVIKLAIKSFLNRQSLYKNELEELKRWSEGSGLSKMGFGREKTTYCYFLAAVPTCLPLHSDLRKIVAKCAIIVIIADDFFDEKGSLNELECLTEAVHRWKGESLWGDAKVIFDALDELVRDIAFKSFSQYDNGVEDVLHDMVRFDLSLFSINIH
ncbi:S-linalool synthase-like [Musa acuminata AAA Group]|uniref:S-linalool synthase-like n=1 Tax=Musa acuminata AAA Group TaxID=214697 RepID=UPI0031D766B2